MPRTPLLLVLVALALTAAAGRPAHAQERPPVGDRRREPAPVPVGTFVAQQIDRETLPVTDRVVDDDGTLYLIEFDRLVLTIGADYTFRASVRYRRTLFSSDPRGRARPTPLQSATFTGRFMIALNEIHFVPDPSSQTGSVRMLAGTITNPRELSIPFHYRNGTQERNRTLVMRRQENVF